MQFSPQSLCLNGLLSFGMLCVGFTSALIADGPKDNLPDQVRRIPRLGVEVPEEVRETLTELLERLENRLGELKQQKDAELDSLLVDVDIFHRAVKISPEPPRILHEERHRQSEATTGNRLGSLPAANICRS